MLAVTEIIQTPATQRLTKLWSERYTPDLFSLAPTQDSWVFRELVEASSLQGRAATIAKLQESLVNLNCQLAVIQAKALYEYISNVVNLREARQLTDFAFQIYIKLLQIYQQPSAISTFPMDKLWANSAYPPISAWGIPNIEDFAKVIEPALIALQKQHVASIDWRALGFMTTQLNFTNKLLLQRLTLVEQALINPYFKFVEEQAAIPWQRVCAAAAKHELDSPAFLLVEQMMPFSTDIARTVYQELAQQFPEYRSRRGGLDNQDVARSCLRDLEMFQAYLWLSVLEDNMMPIKQELVTLCVMVVETVEVKWELTSQWNQLLIDEINSRITPDQQAFLQPYVEGLKQSFYAKRRRLGMG
ncbi:hypothetical protein IFO70_22365 [Phormidium tenue FACHB-886]|nr:hypothetical protein [Phormidium tenue FACHB-886]